MRDAVIVDAVRTPIGRGKPSGALHSVHPVDLMAHSLRTLVERTGIDPALVDDVIGGVVSQVGEQGVNMTRRASLAAGLRRLRTNPPTGYAAAANDSTPRLVTLEHERADRLFEVPVLLHLSLFLDGSSVRQGEQMAEVPVE